MTARVGVTVRLFAMQRELAGTRQVELSLEPPATIESAWDALVGRFPALAPGRAAVRFALNGEYASLETPLADGDEVACIPPVSGGSGRSRPGDVGSGRAPGSDVPAGSEVPAGSAPTTRIVELRADPFDAGLLAELANRLAIPADGAVVAFLGVTRETPGTPAPGQETEAARHAGRAVKALEYEALDSLALRVLGEIADEIATRFDVDRLAIVHRTGTVRLGEPSIAVVAAAPHRAAAFDAARYAIDETKARAPIWKAEQFADGHVWIGAPARTGPATDDAPGAGGSGDRGAGG
jgi:molybdopterin converting factor subunit 1